MKYHTLYVFFLKKQQNLKLSSAADYTGGALWVRVFRKHISPPTFHWTAIPLRSWRSRIFSKIIPNRRESVD